MTDFIENTNIELAEDFNIILQFAKIIRTVVRVSFRQLSANSIVNKFLFGVAKSFRLLVMRSKFSDLL